MKRLPFIAAALVALVPTSSRAFYTECSVQKDIELANRPGGQTEPRWVPLEKGNKVAIRDTYQDWVFVLHWTGDSSEYGWLPRNALASCRPKEGTP